MQKQNKRPGSGLSLLIGYLVLTLFMSACSSAQEVFAEPTSTPIPAPTSVPIKIETFETLWQIINDNFLYEDFGGVDWQSAYDEYLPRARTAATDEEFARVLEDMVGKLPEGTVSLLTREDRIQAEISDSLQYEGIGAFVAFRTEPEPHVVLLMIIPESPAERAGLQAHDSILAVDGDPVLAEEGLDVVDRIRGPSGSIVRLTVLSPGQEIREVEVTRGQLTAAAQIQVAQIPNSNVYYFLFPPSPYEAMATEFGNAYDTFSNESGIDGIIFDLRVAGGRGGWPLELLLSIFTDGNLGEFYTRNETTPILIQGQDFANSQSIPIVVLVGPDTGGLPEVFAAVMQANQRAMVIGLPTEGNVEAFSQFLLPDGSETFVISTSFRTSAGIDIGEAGVTPDIIIEADWDMVSSSFDPVLGAAIQALLE